MTITVYHNPRCSKSRAALTYLDEKGANYTVVKYLDEPLTSAQITELLKRGGISPQDAVRKGETEYKELGLASASDAELIDAMALHPRLIERPIVSSDKGVVIARPTEFIDQVL